LCTRAPPRECWKQISSKAVSLSLKGHCSLGHTLNKSTPSCTFLHLLCGMYLNLDTKECELLDAQLLCPRSVQEFAISVKASRARLNSKWWFLRKEECCCNLRVSKRVTKIWICGRIKYPEWIKNIDRIQTPRLRGTCVNKK
jgi:hypothetical protein